MNYKNITGNYNDLDYVVAWFSRNGHYNGYVRIPDNHPYVKFFDKIAGYDYMNIDCHGGLTFSEKITNKTLWEQPFPDKGYWIGWDYAHCGDKTKYSNTGILHTAEEIELECKNVIDQLLNLALDGKIKEEER